MGVDIGSSRCKAAVFDIEGQLLAEAVTEYSPEFPGPSMVEMDPEVIWRAVKEAVSRAARSAGDDSVTAVGLSSHGETFVPTDERGEPIANAILNSDSRASEEAVWWEQTLGRKRIFEITGLIPDPMFTLTKITWLRDHRPDLFSSAARFVGISDYCLTRMGLPPYMSYSLASRVMAFGVRACAWSQEILALAGIVPERLPIPAPSGTMAGELSRRCAHEMGLRPGTAVVVGGHDQPCGAVGMGAVRPGLVSESIGTYEALTAISEQPCLSESALGAGLNSGCHVIPGRYATVAYFPSGVMVKWYCDNFCQEDFAAARARNRDPYQFLEEKASAEAGPTGLCILPHLIGSGNPDFDRRATGVMVGLVQTTNRYQIYRGILEGLACETALAAQLLADSVGTFDTIRATGGGARSQLGLSLRAAITGRRLQTLVCPEAVCLGAAILAGVGVGLYPGIEQTADQVVKVARSIEPDPKLAADYARQAKQYRLLYQSLAAVRAA